jgi:hypothetical protein
MGGYYTARTWVAAESRLKNVARALCGPRPDLPETFPIADSRCIWNNHLHPKLLGAPDQGTDLLLAISCFVVRSALIDVLLAVFDQAVEQACQFARHGGDGLRCAQPCAQATVLRSQIALAAQ